MNGPLLLFLKGVTMVKCKDCKYSLVNKGQRYCLRYPPSVRLENPIASGYISVYTVVDNNWKCGEGVTK